MFAQVLLTFSVWICLLYYRLSTIMRNRIHPQVVATEAKFDEVYKTGVNLSDNFENLFEVPVLFYAAILTLAYLQKDDSTALGLSWAFVAFRAAHSIVHTTVNIIRARFFFYVASSFCVWAIWFRIVLQAL